MRVELYQMPLGTWRWKAFAVGNNLSCVARSRAEGYKTKEGCLESLPIACKVLSCGKCFERKFGICKKERE